MRVPRLLLVTALGAGLTQCTDRDPAGPPAAPAVEYLQFTRTPWAALSGKSLDTVVVRAIDSEGRMVTAAAVPITLSLQVPTGAMGQLAGSLTAQTSGGLAVFSGVAVVGAGEGYALVASSPGLSNAFSASFAVEPPPVIIDSTQLRLTSDPTDPSGVLTFDVMNAGASVAQVGQVIAGTARGGYFRRVTSIQDGASTIAYTTSAAGLEEVIQNDSLVFRPGEVVPGAALYERPAEVPLGTAAFVASARTISGGNGDYRIDNHLLYGTTSNGVILRSGRFRMTFNPVLTADFGIREIKSVEVSAGTSIAFDATWDVVMSAGIQRSGSLLLGYVTYPSIVPVFGVPVYVEFEIPITLEWQLSAEGRAQITVSWTSGASASVGARWRNGQGWSLLRTADLTLSPAVSDPQLDASATLRLGLQAAPGIVVMNSAGGNLLVQPFVQGEAAVDVSGNRYSLSCRSAVDVGLRLHLSIFGRFLAAYETRATLLDRSWQVCARSGPVRPPNAPGSLGSTPVSPTQVRLQWIHDGVSVDGFGVERAPAGTSNFVLIPTTIGPNAREYQDAGLQSATSYTYRIFAYNPLGSSAYSTGTTVTTLPPSVMALTVATTGTGSGVVTSSPSGISCGTTCSASFASGTPVTLTATPQTGSFFSGWSGGGCGGTGACQVSMNQPVSVNAMFSAQSQTLDVTKNGTGLGTVTSNPTGISCGVTCSASFSTNASVTLTATPGSGSVFAGWSGGGCGGTVACQVTLNQPISVSATFNSQASALPLTVTMRGTGSGTVTSSPAGISCGTTCTASFGSSTSVILTAAPAAGSVFSGWSGGACAGIGTCAVTMNQALTVTASFDAGTAVWSDGFESYALNAWPSPNWSNSGNTAGYVDGASASGGSRSLKLYGIVGSFWAAIAHRPIGATGAFTIECSLLNGAEALPSGGHQYRGGIDLHRLASWSSGARGLIAFHKDGRITGPSGEELGRYEVNRWYRVRLKYEYPVDGQVRITTWVDDTQLGQSSLAPASFESSLGYVSLTAGAGSVWFDDCRVTR